MTGKISKYLQKNFEFFRARKAQGYLTSDAALWMAKANLTDSERELRDNFTQ